MVGYPGPIVWIKPNIEMRKNLFYARVIAVLAIISTVQGNLHAQTPTDTTVTNPLDTLPQTTLNQVVIVVTIPHTNTPMAMSNVNANQISPLNNGQDLPYLLRFTPSLVVTSDAGNGVGYTGMWLRGSDPSRINISINDIPLNDPESQQVFWVNTPDLGSSATNVNIQRGVGTSSSGVGAFGGSVRIDTREYSIYPYTRFSTNYGSFNTMRNTLAFGTGRVKDHFRLNARLSQISSDGYLDRASTELYSAYVDAEIERLRGTWRLIAFSGRERTYQSWYGTPHEVLYGTQEDRENFAARNGFSEEQANNLLSSGRTYNFYDYSDQVDLYGQDHLQLNYRRVFRKKLNFSATLNYTRGGGYFEEEKKDESYARYGFAPQILGNDTINITDVIRRRWLRNHFFGGVFSMTQRLSKTDITWGGNVHHNKGEHFGEIIWMEYAGNIQKNERYYQGWSDKFDAGSYVRVNRQIGNKFDAYLDAQVRFVDYVTNGVDNDLMHYSVDTNFLFFNPKIGLTYLKNEKWKYFISIARGNKEPNRNDFIDASDVSKVKHESMTDLEIGANWKNGKWDCSANVYYMDYTNQLVLNGTLNDVGAPLRTNVKDSYRAGVEMTGAFNHKWHDNQAFSAMANLTLSRNRISQFENVLYDYSGSDVLVVSEKMKDVPISFSPDVISGVQLQYTRFTLWPEEHAMRTVSPAEQRIRTRAPFSVMLMWKLVGKQYMDNTGNDAVALDAYQLLDGRISYEYVSLKSGHAIEFSVGVNNILGTSYVSNGYTYSYIYGDRVTERFYYPQALRQWNVGLKFTI
jgi:iron complex outermembrane recepter protein